MMGDELRLRHKCPSGRPPWEGTGHVVNTGGSSEEVSWLSRRRVVSRLTSGGAGLALCRAALQQLLCSLSNVAFWVVNGPIGCCCRRMRALCVLSDGAGSRNYGWCMSLSPPAGFPVCLGLMSLDAPSITTVVIACAEA